MAWAALLVLYRGGLWRLSRSHRFAIAWSARLVSNEREARLGPGFHMADKRQNSQEKRTSVLVTSN